MWITTLTVMHIPRCIPLAKIIISRKYDYFDMDLYLLDAVWKKIKSKWNREKMVSLKA
jgi:hypothetical protein